MSACEITHFTSKSDTYILATKADETPLNTDTITTEHDEQEHELDLSGYEAMDQSTAEYPCESTNVLDLSTKDRDTNDSQSLTWPKPNVVQPDRPLSPTKSELKIKLVGACR